MITSQLLVNGGTVITSTLTNVNGTSTCVTGPTHQINNACASASANSFAAASATVSMPQNAVSVSIAGSAWGMPEAAQAFASALLSLDFLIEGSAAGCGLLQYSVELSARHTGVPGASASSVYFNGSEYRVFPNGYVTVSFTRAFEYGRPFTVDLGVNVRNSWTGYGGEGGTSYGAARLVSAHTEPNIPEPSSLLLWVASVVTIFVASIRRRGAMRKR